MIAHHKNPNSIAFHFWHLLSEVEIIFGLWSFVFLILFALDSGVNSAVTYLDSLNFTEPAFVFVIMCMAATRPVIYIAEVIILGISSLLPFSKRMSFYIAALIVGPVLGSLITEPAAMTVTALILLKTIYKEQISLKLKYATIALLFVNVSIGGTLTTFAAPPVLMVASKWNWDTFFMLKNFGFKAVIAIVFSTFIYAFIFRKELKGTIKKEKIAEINPKPWKIFIHLLFLLLVVVFSHHAKVFIAIFFLFLGFMTVTQNYQDKLKIKESFLVGFFLAGLVCLGTMQAWWLNALMSHMNDLALFFGSTALTSITDNAALTYLGSLVDLSDSAKYALVAGAVAGGGLTVIANAPNPAGFGILGESFGSEGINPFKLFLWALLPTTIAMICFFLL
jgi:Na+/H+ antiporter NhaD/arsenite permease-like protein